MGDQPAVLALAGLTENESRVATALLELGPCGAGSLIKRTGLHRELVYSALGRLSHRGLASSLTRNNVKEFSLDKAKIARLLQGRIDEINSFIPSMLAPSEKKETQIRVFQGDKGLKLLSSELASESEILFLGFPPYAQSLAESLGIKNKILAQAKAPFKSARLLPPSLILSLPLAACGAKSLLFPGGDLALLLESPGTASSSRALFQSLWKAAKE